MKKTIEVNIPDIYELKESLEDSTGETLPLGTIVEIEKAYLYELSSLLHYCKSATKPSVSMTLFFKQGSQHIANFSVNDLGIERTESHNWHGQNTSQWLYAGGILYDERDGSVSTHH